MDEGVGRVHMGIPQVYSLNTNLKTICSNKDLYLQLLP